MWWSLMDDCRSEVGLVNPTETNAAILEARTRLPSRLLSISWAEVDLRQSRSDPQRRSTSKVLMAQVKD